MSEDEGVTMPSGKTADPAVTGGAADVPDTVDTTALRKARGAFFTPPALARYVAEWTIRDSRDTVLEPSCGEAEFLLAAHRRQADLGGHRRGGRRSAVVGRLDGVELHEQSAVHARRLLAEAGADPDIVAGDFFTLDPAPVYDAVIGNPPYVRYQDFSGPARTRSRAAALRAGVSLTNLASSWAAFTVHAALFLKPGGRLGLVLPAELLSVNYAAEVRRYLMARFARVRLVMFTKRIFPGVLEEVVLLLAEGTGPTDHCELLQVHDVDDLLALGGGSESVWTPPSSAAKWTSALLPPQAAAVYHSLTGSSVFTGLESWGDTSLGMVTGNNRFFALSQANLATWTIGDDDLMPISPPGSRHLRGLSFTSSMRAELTRRGSATMLFRPAGDPGPGAARYIRHGESEQFHLAYKCRIRSPWWRVPLVSPADLLLTYMNADTPRLSTNQAGVRHLNSVHGVYLRPDHRAIGRSLLPIASLNSATLLGAETVGRAYGGGMLKLEPREADLLPVPSPEQVALAADRLSAVRDRVASRLREGRLMDAVRLVDEALLVRSIGASRSDVSILEQAHAALTARRLARGAGPKP